MALGLAAGGGLPVNPASRPPSFKLPSGKPNCGLDLEVAFGLVRYIERQSAFGLQRQRSLDEVGVRQFQPAAGATPDFQPRQHVGLGGKAGLRRDEGGIEVHRFRRARQRVESRDACRFDLERDVIGAVGLRAAAGAHGFQLHKFRTHGLGRGIGRRKCDRRLPDRDIDGGDAGRQAANLALQHVPLQVERLAGGSVGHGQRTGQRHRDPVGLEHRQPCRQTAKRPRDCLAGIAGQQGGLLARHIHREGEAADALLRTGPDPAMALLPLDPCGDPAGCEPRGVEPGAGPQQRRDGEERDWPEDGARKPAGSGGGRGHLRILQQQSPPC